MESVRIYYNIAARFQSFSHINVADLVPERPGNVLYPLHLKVVRGWGDRDGGWGGRIKGKNVHDKDV